MTRKVLIKGLSIYKKTMEVIQRAGEETQALQIQGQNALMDLCAAL